MNQWKNYVIAALLTVGVLLGAFYLKLTLGNLSISVHTLFVGGLAAGVLGVILLLRGKAPVLFAAALTVLVVWLAMPGDGSYSAALLGAGAVGLCFALPFTAALFTRREKQNAVS